VLTKPIHTKIAYIVLLAAALLLPFFIPDRYMFQVVIMSIIFAISTSAMNLMTGFTGQLSLAHAGFFGIGAYGVANLTKAGISFWIALPISALIAAFVGLLLGLLTLRTKGPYFAIVTLCFGVILYITAGNWIEVTGGHNGIFGIPRPSPIPIPFIGAIEFWSQTAQWYLVLAFLLLTLFVLNRLVYSVFGLGMMACRNNDALAESVGINIFRTKLISFVLCNFIAAAAGGLYAATMGAVSPSAATYLLTFNFLIFMILGGMATLAGPVLGAFIIPIIMEALQFLGDYRLLFFGALLIAAIIYFPQGVYGGLRQLNQKVAAWRQS